MKLKKVMALGLAVVTATSMFSGCAKSESGSSSDSILLGGIGPLTGSAAVYGQAVKNGAELAISEINADGGVNGIKLELNFQDDELNNEKAVNAYNTLKDKGAKIILGSVTSGSCVAVSEMTHADNMFQLTPSGSSVDCTQYDNAFRVCFNDPNQGLASAQYLYKNKVAEKVAIIYDSSDVYSSGIYEKFKAESDSLGLNIVETQAFTKDTNSDFSVQLKKIQDSGADLVFLPIYYQQAALILSQADKAGIKVKFFGCDGLDGIIDQLGDDVKLAEGVMLLTPFAADAADEKTQTFTKAFKAKYNETPNQFAADAYDAVYTIKAAMEKAGIKDASMNVSDLCDKLKDAMTQIEVKGVTGTMVWTADGEPTKDPKAMVIENGAYKAL